MMDLLFVGRILNFTGSAALALMALGLMIHAKDWELFLLEALLSLVFSFHAFTIMMSVALSSQVVPGMKIWILINGIVHMSAASAAAGVLWKSHR